MRLIDADALMSQAFTTKQGYDAVLVEDIVNAPTVNKESIIKAFLVGVVDICNKQEMCANCKLVHMCPCLKDSFEHFPVLEYVHECLQMMGDTNNET